MKVDRFKRGQIWWYENNGYDFDGKTYNITNKKRPVIIVSNNLANRYSNTLLAIPCTTQDKKEMPTHLHLDIHEPSTAMCECLMSVDTSKLLNYIGTCDEQIIAKLENCIKIALGLDNKEKTLDSIKEVNFKSIVNIPVEETIQEPKIKEKSKRGAKIKYTLDDKKRFLNDYENHTIDYMMKKYSLKDKKAFTNKLYTFKKDVEGAGGI